MGAHFTVTVDKGQCDTELNALRYQFQPLEESLCEIAAHWTSIFPHIGPPLEPWRDATELGRTPSDLFYMPGGFTLSCGSSAFRLHHVSRIDAFISDHTTRVLLRNFSRRLCSVLATNFALYSPCEGVGDEIAAAVSEGLSVGDIERRFRQLGDPPSPISQLGSMAWPRRRYHIDRFEDLSPT
jgi:hypothetical protein